MSEHIPVPSEREWTPDEREEFYASNPPGYAPGERPAVKSGQALLYIPGQTEPFAMRPQDVMRITLDDGVFALYRNGDPVNKQDYRVNYTLTEKHIDMDALADEIHFALFGLIDPQEE